MSLKKKPNKFFKKLCHDCIGVVIPFIFDFSSFYHFQLASKTVRETVTSTRYNFPVNVVFLIANLGRYNCPKQKILYVQRLGISSDLKLLCENKHICRFLHFFPRLRDIDISTIRLLTDKVFEGFDLKKLTRINVTNAGGVSYKSISKMIALEELVNDEETIFGSSTVQLFHKNHPLPPSLKKIRIGMKSSLEGKIFEKLKKLEDVNIYDEPDFDDETMNRLKRMVIWEGFDKYKSLDDYPFQKLSNLRVLVLMNGLTFKEKEEDQLKTLTKLEELVLIQVSGFTGASFKHLKHLKKLRIKGGYRDEKCTLESKNFNDLKTLKVFHSDGFYSSYLSKEVLRNLSSTCYVIRLCCKENMIETLRTIEYDLTRNKSSCPNDKCSLKHIRCQKCRKCPKCPSLMMCSSKKCAMCKKKVCSKCISSSMCELCHRYFCKKCRVVKIGRSFFGEDLEHLCVVCLRKCKTNCDVCGKYKVVTGLSTCEKCEKKYCWDCEADCGEVESEEKMCMKCSPPDEYDDDYF